MKLVMTTLIVVALLALVGCGGGSSVNSTEVTEAVQTYKHWKVLDHKAEYSPRRFKLRADEAWREVLGYSHPVQEAMADQIRSERK